MCSYGLIFTLVATLHDICSITSNRVHMQLASLNLNRRSVVAIKDGEQLSFKGINR